MRNRGLQLALFFAAAGICGAAGATAGSSARYSQKSAVVRYSEDDLASASGATHLYAKLERAARFVCDAADIPMDLETWSDISRCEHVAIAKFCGRRRDRTESPSATSLPP